MDASDKSYNFDRVFRLALTVAGFLFVFYLVYFLRDVLLPFTIALVLAYLLNPIATRIQAKTGKRSLAVLLTVFGLLVACVGIVGFVIPRVIGEMGEFSRNIQQMYEKDPTLGGLLTQLPPDIKEQVSAIVKEAAENINQQMIIDAAKNALPRFWGILTGALSTLLSLMTLVVIFIYVVFLLLDFQSFQATWKDYLPPPYRESIVEFFDEFSDAMSKYFRGQAIVALCVGVLFAIGLSLLGIRLAILLGLMIGLMNMVPYLQIVGLVPAILLAVLRAVETEASPLLMLLGVLVVFAVVQLIQDTLLTPRIIGKTTGLRPAVILLAITVWGKLLGPLGLVLAIPLTCLAFAYYRRIIKTWRESAPS